MKKTIAVFLLLAACLLWRSVNAQTSVGELELHHDQGPAFSGVLLTTDIQGEVTGMLASITIKQQFKNTSDHWAHGKYLFPLPEDAAVDSLTLEVGNRVIRGRVKEKQAAKVEFQQAKKAGKKASLLQQSRPNLFSMNIANIAPQETVTATITLVDVVEYRDQTFAYALPTTFTPRYTPTSKSAAKIDSEQLEKLLKSEELELQSTSGFSTQSIDSSVNSAFRYQNGGDNSQRFSLRIKLNTGLQLDSVRSNFAITQQVEGDALVIELANGLEAMNRDFDLSWSSELGAPKAAVFQQSLAADDHYSLVMLMPPAANSQLSLPRDITFIIDSSGSMAGTSMRQAKQALLAGLSELAPQDKFNIVDFDSQYRPLFPASQWATQENKQKARSMVNGLVADGGTEMMGALQFAMNAHQDSSYLHQIIFITDGAVGNEQALFHAINQQLRDARLFTIGIGSAPNSYFMSKAAQYGRGTFTYVRDLSEVNKQVSALFKKISQPLMRDIKLNWSADVDQYPARIPDLYAGDPIVVLARSDKAINFIEAKGNMLNTPWQQNIKAGDSANSDGLDTTWARRKIAHLMDQNAVGQLDSQQVKNAVLALALKHQVMSRFTSFIAVEETVSRPSTSHAEDKKVANLMPKGSTMPIPQTATAAELLSLLGLLFLTLGLILLRQSRGSLQQANCTRGIL